MTAVVVDVPEFAVSRPSLMGRLNTAVVEDKLTSIVGPPGFGKSMLVRQWISGVRRAIRSPG